MLSENELKTRLMEIMRVVSAYAGKNDDLRKALSDVLERPIAVDVEMNQADFGIDSMPSPFALLQEKGTDGFRDWVTSLAIEDLKKVISAHRLDATGNARKWKTKEKLVIEMKSKTRIEAKLMATMMKLNIILRVMMMADGGRRTPDDR